MKKHNLLVVVDTVQARIFKIDHECLDLLQELNNSEEISIHDAKRKTVSGIASSGSVPGRAWEKRNISVKDTARKRFCEAITSALKQHIMVLDAHLKISILADSKMLGELRKHFDDASIVHTGIELAKDVAGYPLGRLEKYAKSKGIIGLPN